MELWEFLLQKEGDRSWLPLESPNVEILEGRYRVVARSNTPNTALEIRVSHQDIKEATPVRRTQKRTSKTNDQGLVVIMPFTRLQAGAWELRCTGDLMDEMLGQGWTKTLQLQVAPVGLEWQDETLPESNGNLTGAEGVDAYLSEGSSDISSNLSADIAPEIPANIPEPSPELSPEASPEIFTAIAPEISSEVSPEGFPAVSPEGSPESSPEPFPESSPEPSLHPSLEIDSESSLEPSPASSPEETFSVPETALAVSENPSLQLQLDRDTWILQREQTITLTGTIAPIADSSSAILPLGQLRVRLFDPQTSQMLCDQHYPLAAGQPLPAPFSCELALPDNCKTYVIIGELALYGMTQPGQLPPVLATQSFNVTTELHELLEAIANDYPDPDPATFAPPITKSSPLDGVDLSFFNLPPLTQTYLDFQEESPAEPAPASFSFDLSKPYVSPQPKPEAEPQPTAETHPESNQPESNQPESSEPHPVQPVQTESTAPSPELVDDLTSDWDEDWEIAEDGSLNWRQHVHAPEPTSPEDRAFRSLNLQDRFLNRLQSLATDPKPSRFPVVDPLAQEIVVDDDPPADELDDELDPELDGDRAHSNTQPQSKAPAEPRSSLFHTITRTPFSDEPVPVPQIEIPSGDLLPEQPITIRVTLPRTAARTYVKLWVRDRQTRGILDGPRWLIDLKPNGFGALVAQTPVTLPAGCMEVQFEAIAIEMTDQSESQRAVEVRAVQPPEYMALSLEGMDF
jgi:hypothetical protein